MRFREVNLAAGVSIALCALSQVALSATLCVNNKPHSGCYPTISQAVAAASAGDVVQVSHGVYHEDVAITRSISLVGAQSANTIIDATGLANGISITGIGAVTVSGFTIQNANFEGILLNQATGITISDNIVRANNVNLDVNNLSCPGIPPFETAEGFDCGEGIHLSGVDHSVISNNLVQSNSGGILLSDDTGATHDNLIIGNIVQDNPLDCGITLASHPLYNPMGGPPTAAGVYHNTIMRNISKHNGFQVPGAGAGVGLFSPAPFTNNYANVVVDNDLVDNGLPGVAMHAHAPGAGLNDNMIAGNRISGNGADTADTATPGPTGINVSGGDDGSGNPLAVITGTVIASNIIQQETDAIVAKTNALVGAHLNNFFGIATGVDNLSSLSNSSVDATLNWWGCAMGPSSPGCAAISGTGIMVQPVLTSPH